MCCYHVLDLVQGSFTRSAGCKNSRLEPRTTHSLLHRALQSVVNEPSSVAHPQLEGRQRHLVDVADTEEANLLQHLPAAVAFVTAALRGGAAGTAAAAGPGASSNNRVLIHCAQGVSRSAAVAVACLMARNPELEPEAALAALRQRYPAASPNAGAEVAPLLLLLLRSSCTCCSKKKR